MPGDYELWNAALADVVFSEDMAHKPVFLDIEEDVLVEAGRRLGAGEDPEVLAGLLTRAVRETLGQGRGLFKAHRAWLERWRRESGDQPPPVVAVLATCSMAAELMANDDDVVSWNYYHRFCQLLDLDPRDRKEIATGYRLSVLPLWRGLVEWLEANGGRRGVPTVRERGANRHIAPALGQALVRKAERDKLPRFFAWAGLRPEQEVELERLKGMLGRWVQNVSNPLSNRLTDRWDQTEVRTALADAAQAELLSWDGIVDRGGGDGGAVKLVAIPRRRGGLGLAITVVGATDMPSSEVRVGDEPHETRWQSLGDGLWLDTSTADVDLLSSPIRVGNQVREQRQVTVFRREGGRYLEVPGLELGEQQVVIANDKLEAIAEAIRAIARPGFVEEDLGRWRAYVGVEVGRAIAPEDLPVELRPLATISGRRFGLVDGLKLPGSRGAWHTGAPPVLRVVDPGIERFRATLERPGDARHVDLGEHSSAAPLVIDDHVAGPGPYLLVLRYGRERASTASFVLADSDEPSVKWLADAPTYVDRSAANGRAMFHGAVAGEPGSPVPSLSARQHPADVDLPLQVGWDQRTGAAPAVRDGGQVQLPAAEASSEFLRESSVPCSEGGFHFQDLDRGRGKNPPCVHCNMVPSQARLITERLRDLLADLPPPSELEDRAPVQPDVLLDGVRHLRGGTMTRLRDWLAGAGLNAIQRAEFTRDLVGHGHIEVAAPNRDGAKIWSVTRPALLGHADDSEQWMLVGMVCRSVLRDLHASVDGLGGTVGSDTPGEARVPITRVAGIGLDDVTLLSGVLDADVEIVADAGKSLARCIGPLDPRSANLPQRNVTQDTIAVEFDPKSARWTDEPLPIERSGAYRVGIGYRDEYWWVDEPGKAWLLPDGDVAKVLSARMHGIPLLAYVEGALAVPLGARLPSLYERAAVFASHRSPVRVGGHIAYPDVPGDVAAAIYAALYD